MAYFRENKFNFMARHFWLFIILSLFPGIINAQIIDNQISLEEISFNADPDYLKFKNVSNQQINLKDLEFWDDKLFKKITADYLIEPQQSITLTFNSESIDQPALGKIFTTYKGLTATTEQILLKQTDRVLDFFCWTSDKPSQAELKEWEKNNYSQLLNNQNLQNCFPSKGIKKSQSVLRVAAGQNSSAWKLQAIPEKSPTKKESQSSNSKSTSTKSTAQKSNITFEDNQTPSKQILISEIFPAPDQKSSQNQEWIELYNPSDSNINLNGWYLDDEEGGSKPFQFGNTTIKPGETLLIGASQSKINLNNSDEAVRLFDSQKQLIDLIEYKKSTSAQSYSLIKIITLSPSSVEDSLLLWSNHPTPNQPNPQLIEMEGLVSRPAQFQTPYFFEITTAEKNATDSPQKIIIFNEKTLPAPLAKTLLIANQPIKILAFPIDNQTINNAPDLPFYQLHSLETTESQESSTENFNLNFPILCVIILATLYLLQKKYQWIKLT
jgi:hypothetical protein